MQFPLQLSVFQGPFPGLEFGELFDRAWNQNLLQRFTGSEQELQPSYSLGDSHSYVLKLLESLYLKSHTKSS